MRQKQRPINILSSSKMTALTEGALDLSAKATHGDCKAPSPVSSLASDHGDHHHNPMRSRAGSVSTDGGRESDTDLDSSMGESHRESPIKPVAGPIPTNGMFSKQPVFPGVEEPTLSPGSDHSSALSPGSDGIKDPNGSSTPARPFKMYPFDPLPGMYSQLAAAAAAASQQHGGHTMYPYPNPAMPVNILDNAITLSSPIGQYLQNRKRRAEQRMTSSNTTTSSVGNGGTNGSPVGGGGLGGGGASPLPGQMTPKLPNGYHTNGSGAGSGSESGDGNSGFEHSAKKAKASNNFDGEGENRDDSYWERRRKNNEAAKRSRDARRAKEEEIALRAAFLEQENLKLRAQVAILKNETAKLHYMLYNRM